MLSQFTPEPGSKWRCLADYIPIAQVYAAGRLDADSEGLLILTSNGRLQQRLTDPRFGHWRRYWAQVEGEAQAAQDAIQQLQGGLLIQGQKTLAAKARVIADPRLGDRDPPIRHRQSIPTSWLEIELREGRNRQVRRMTAAVGMPTLRLVRVAIDLMDGHQPLGLAGLAPGEWRQTSQAEEQRIANLLSSPGRGGRAGGGKSGRAGGGG